MLDRVINLARANPVVSLPRVAAVVADKRGRILGIGLNKYKTHPLQAKFGSNPCAIYLHAEIAAIVDAQGCDFSNATMYVARVLKNGQPALAKPCPGCQMAIQAFGLKDCVWTE